MRVLLVVLLVGIVGCGGNDNSPGDVAIPTPKSSQAKTDKPPAQAADADAALKNLGAEIHRNDQGEVVEVDLNFNDITDAGLVHLKGLPNLQNLSLFRTKVTDAGLVHLKGLTSLQTLNLYGTQITDAGLVHLKGLTGLQELYLFSTEITDAGVAELQKALPNCGISK